MTEGTFYGDFFNQQRKAEKEVQMRQRDQLLANAGNVRTAMEGNSGVLDVTDTIFKSYLGDLDRLLLPHEMFSKLGPEGYCQAHGRIIEENSGALS